MATRGLSLVNVTPEPRATVSDSVDWRKKYEELEKSLRQKHDDLDKSWRQKHESLDKNWRQKQDELEKNLRSKQDKLEGDLRQKNQETTNSWQKKYNDMESKWRDVHEQARTQFEGLQRDLDQTVAQNKRTEDRFKELDSKHKNVILEHGKIMKDLESKHGKAVKELESGVEKRIREGIDQRLKAMEVKYKAEIQALQAEVSALKNKPPNPNLASQDLAKRHGEVVEEMRRTIDGMKKREAELNQQIKREQSSKETFSQLASDLRTKMHEHESNTKGLRVSHTEIAEKLKKCKTFTDKVGQMMELCSSDPVFDSYPALKQNFAKTRDFTKEFGKTLR